MAAFDDPGFFMLLAVAIAGAALLGLREKPLKWYGLFVSAAFFFLLFFKTPSQLGCALLFLALAGGGAALVLRGSGSKTQYCAALALTLLPLVVCKVSGVFGENLLGFAGVSYLTFKAVQVVIEAHDGLIRELSVSDWLAFLLFFPVFTSGPIDRSRRFLEDLRAARPRDEYAGMLARGILLIAAGLVYKVVVAGYVHRFYNPAPWGSDAFGVELFSQVETAYLYGIYLFFDFAGYGLMSMGASYCFGIRTPRNFRAPFLAVDIKDFWNRWHITLSFWLRDFVFMRLSRALLRRKVFKKRLHTAQCALVANMLIMGVWHGLAPNYVLYGLFHGVLLAATEGFQKTKFYKAHRASAVYKAVSWFVTMQLVMFGFALFSGQLGMVVLGLTGAAG